MATDTRLILVCNACGRVVRVPASAVGKVGRCPECGGPVRVPAGGDGDAPIDLGAILDPPAIPVSAPPPPVPQPSALVFGPPAPRVPRRTSWYALAFLAYACPFLIIVDALLGKGLIAGGGPPWIVWAVALAGLAASRRD